MSLPFSRDAFFAVFAAYNEALWPFAVVLWLLTASAFLLLVRDRARPGFISGLLAIHWAWAGLVYHAAFFSRINPAAWVFGGLFLLEAGLLGWHGVVRRRFPFSRRDRIHDILSSALIAYALLYPVIARANGHVYPETPTFGVPCPTTILTIGFLMAANAPLPWGVTLIPIVWGFIGGSAAPLLGVHADWMLLAAGMLLLLDQIASRIRRACHRAGRGRVSFRVERTR